MKNISLDAEQEYERNVKFRLYVDKYCKGRGITTDVALRHEIVRQVLEEGYKESGNEKESQSKNVLHSSCDC